MHSEAVSVLLSLTPLNFVEGGGSGISSLVGLLGLALVGDGWHEPGLTGSEVRALLRAVGAESVVERAVSLTGARMKAVASAFVCLVRTSWPKPELVRQFEEAERERDAAAMCGGLLAAFDAAQAEYPTAMFWWKDEGSHFFGFCPRFSSASGLAAFDLFGRTDVDPRVAWSRQGALYLRDDREVLSSFVPRFDILERQDRDGAATVWLRTSKVPYRGAAGSGTVGGFDTISGSDARELAKRQVPRSPDGV